MALALLPQVKGISHLHLPAFDDRLLQVLADHHIRSLDTAFPFVEVLSDLTIDHSFDGCKSALFTRANSCLCFALNILIQAFNRGLAVTLESLRHQHELLIFFALAKRIEAHLH